MDAGPALPALCRSCLATFDGPGRCPACRSPRTRAHAELHHLAIAHLDADAFYASVEKRDDPALQDRPVIVGGGRRGVVTTACYIARLRGVRSAMPMFQALRLCPEAVVIRPRMDHYAAVSRQIRAMMAELTPLVEPISIDEAFLDLSGTARLHRASPVVLLARLQARIESELGLSVSVGISCNKFLAKIASDLEKPRGLALIGRAEAEDFLAPQPLSLLSGVGAATLAALEAEGMRSIADLRRRERDWLLRRFGATGGRLWQLARGEDSRRVSPDRPARSISHETTFDADIADAEELTRHLWDLAESLSARAKAKGVSGRVVTLKLRGPEFRTLTRRQTLPEPTRSADRIFAVALPLLQRDMISGPFRLLGIGLSTLVAGAAAPESADLLDQNGARRHAAEQAVDAIRARFGARSILRGRSLR